MSSSPMQFLLALAAKGTLLLLLTAIAAIVAAGHGQACGMHSGRPVSAGSCWSRAYAWLAQVGSHLATGAECAVLAGAGVAHHRAGNPSSDRRPRPPCARGGRRLPHVPVASRQHAGRFRCGARRILTWATGASLLLAWLLFGHLRVRAIVRAADPALPSVAPFGGGRRRT
jgi:hypothetical protein